MFFFFKQKTAYEMRISDWSSDVCSSDLLIHGARFGSGRDSRPEDEHRGSATHCRKQRFDIQQRQQHILTTDHADEAVAIAVTMQRRQRLDRGERDLRHFADTIDQQAESLAVMGNDDDARRSEEHTSEIQSLMRI